MLALRCVSTAVSDAGFHRHAQDLSRPLRSVTQVEVTNASQP